jgi:hypothetical protein
VRGDRAHSRRARCARCRWQVRRVTLGGDRGTPNLDGTGSRQRGVKPPLDVMLTHCSPRDCLSARRARLPSVPSVANLSPGRKRRLYIRPLTGRNQGAGRGEGRQTEGSHKEAQKVTRIIFCASSCLFVAIPSTNVTPSRHRPNNQPARGP